MPTQSAMDRLRAQWGQMANMDTGYQQPTKLAGNSADAAKQMRDSMYDRYLGGQDVNDLGSIMNQYFYPEADRLQGQLPGLEQQYLETIQGGVDYGQIGEGLESSTMGFLRQMFEKGGYFDTQTNISLGENIQSGRGVHGGGFEAGRRTNETTMQGMTADRIAQLIPQLYGSAVSAYGTEVQGMGNLLGLQSGRYDQLSGDIYSGKMGMTNLRMTEEDRIFGANTEAQNVWAQQQQIKAQNNPAGMIGGLLGAAAGSFFGPLGTSVGGALGGKIGGMIGGGGGGGSPQTFSLPAMGGSSGNAPSLYQSGNFFDKYRR